MKYLLTDGTKMFSQGAKSSLEGLKLVWIDQDPRRTDEIDVSVMNIEMRIRVYQ